jgi:transposase-like protein
LTEMTYKRTKESFFDEGEMCPSCEHDHLTWVDGSKLKCPSCNFDATMKTH